ncbi:hypothetical protein V5O48_006824 [Marasmius crinis-equi]|uniref:Oligopeptide transporter n=1 Tax=Marasmius crinis-equi TaxID=585013 RepID=A0ABR3FIF7_9AGAR
MSTESLDNTSSDDASGASSTKVVQDDLSTLRKVPAPIPLSVYLLGFAELIERLTVRYHDELRVPDDDLKSDSFQLFGPSVIFINFIQQPLPASITGAGFADGQSGALGLGQRASTGLTTFFVLWCYVTPLIGGYVADAHFGRMKTMSIAIVIRLIGHIILIVSSLPGVIQHSDAATGVFVVALVVMGLGTGMFSSNISPLLGEQCLAATPAPVVKVTSKGERVLVDPALTISRVFLYFYLIINVAALIGQISLTYCEKFLGFWVAYTLSAGVFLVCPLILFLGRNKIVSSPPSGAVLATVLKFWWRSSKGKWHLNPLATYKDFRSANFWEEQKLKYAQDEKSQASTTVISEQWFDDVKTAIKACKVLCWFPVYWLTYNQLNNNLTSQAATMTTKGFPNDVINNLAPLALVILIPICDLWFYPALRRVGIQFGPLKKLFAGFMIGSAAMVYAAVVQAYVYKTNPCGTHASDCHDASGQVAVSPISVWVQSGCYILIAISEIFAAITGLEHAFTKAPKSMRSFVTAIFLFMSAVSGALSEIFVSLSSDPLLVWNYGVMAVLAAVTGVAFWISVHKMDRRDSAPGGA